ncbi:MAG TPA: pyruvate kinase [Longimicrobiaceae bacterium]
MKSAPRSSYAGAADPDLGEFEELLAQLLAIRADLLAREGQLGPVLDEVPEENRVSARNFVHYAALRSHDLGEIQVSLARLGFSSLGRSESHVLDNIEAVIALLHRLLGWPPPAATGCLSEQDAKSLLGSRTEMLFGRLPEARPIAIMITMPSEAAHDYELVRGLLGSGMNCMRINCAHDDRTAWARMIANLREAQRELGMPCRVMMDIPGPRVRTGAIEPGPEVVKLRPTRDELGWMTAPAQVWLFPIEQPCDPVAPVEARLPLPGEFLEALCVGDRVEFRDARGSSRSMIVTALEGGGRWARLDETAYVVTGTRMTCSGRHGGKRRIEGVVGQLPALARRFLLAPGDLLALTRSQAPGSGARKDATGRVLEIARIPCTPPDALDWVRTGEQIWFDDGRIGGTIKSVDSEKAVVEITSAGVLGEKLAAGRGINLPDTKLQFPSLTAEDLDDLPFIAANSDLVGYSFVRTAEDVEVLQRRLREIGAENLGVVLKIETRSAYENLPQILLAGLRSRAVGVMIARGDLAVECGFTRLAEVQEEILWLCEAGHLPVIWATQVLDRLAKSGRASRAEVTDAAMAERAECIMLNKGDFILEAVRMLDTIVSRMQLHQRKKRSVMGRLELVERFLASAERESEPSRAVAVAAERREKGGRPPRAPS